MNSRTAIFDAFGTVVRIGRRTNPYRQLLREGIKQGRRPHPGDAHLIMTLNLDLRGVAEHLGIHPHGDSARCDRDGARAVGIEGHYLDRSGASPIQDLVQFADLVVERPLL